jgi:UDP:flavonoid glycosyltransferase YjiC (YdhE family)
MPVKEKHLVVVISGHGYGHAAMTAPLVNELYARHPELKITIRSDVALEFLQRKFQMPFVHLPNDSDFGMVNRDAFDVDMEASLLRYRHFHQNWPNRVKTETARLVELGADAILSNIAYLPLAAAGQLGLPCAAYSCLNWAEIFYCHFPEEQAIYKQMLEAYGCADIFIRSEPAMPMEGIDSVTVGPVAEQGHNRRSELLQAFGLPAQTRLVLATMGGIKTEMNMANWPRLDNVHYLVPDLQIQNRDDISALATNDIGFTDILRSVDVLLTKPGYGSFTEAACNRTPVLYVERNNWPEHDYLCRWLEQHLPCRSITRQQLAAGNFATQLGWLLEQTPDPVPPTSGLEQAVALLEAHLKIL